MADIGWETEDTGTTTGPTSRNKGTGGTATDTSTNTAVSTGPTSRNQGTGGTATTQDSLADTITGTVDAFSGFMEDLFTREGAADTDTTKKDDSLSSVLNGVRLSVQGSAASLKSTVLGWIGIDIDTDDPANIMLPEEAGAQVLVDRQMAGDAGVFESYSAQAAFVNQSVYGMNVDSKTEYTRLQNTMAPAKWAAMSAAERVTLARAPQMREQLPHAFMDVPTYKGADGKLLPHQMQYFLQNGGQVDALGTPVPNSMDEGTATVDPAAGGGEGTIEPAYSAQTIIDFAKESGLVESTADIQAIVDDPEKWMSDRNLSLADVAPTVDGDAAGTELGEETGALGDLADIQTSTMTLDELALLDKVDTVDAITYDATTTVDGLSEVTADQGSITDDSTVTAAQIDVAEIAAGKGVLGSALDAYAKQSISSVIDTSTISGKLLASKLGEGNYTDSKATILGQMKIISAEFTTSNGEPSIPVWAQSVARSVNKTMAFSGITGTAQTAMLSTALMEATLGAAEKDSAFFQTLTIANLDNRQEAIINKAKVLAQFEVQNLSARQEAVVENAKAFLKMDLSNLDHSNQARVINAQEYNTALLSDQAAQNVAKQFAAENTTENTQFYATLNATLEKYNAEATNVMLKFNAGETNDTREFNSTMENSRQVFYADMQYKLDSFNAQWRQGVETSNTQLEYDAQAEDVKNNLDLTQEAQNRLWDRVDSTLDYIYQGWDSESQRDMEILKSQIMAQSNAKGGTDWAGKIGDWIFG
jgi:hypothetical protein